MIEAHNMAVTGAFGYSGRYIADKLIARGVSVTTLTNRLKSVNIHGDRLRVAPLSFERPELLTDSLRGTSVLINTYWVRFNHRTFSHEHAVRNTEMLIRAAADAGVRRIVHVSITNPSVKSPFEYFRGKARLEASVRNSGMSFAILRPAVLFGGEDILINNIAWLLRRSPFFGVFGDGQYRLRPIHVDDFAELAVQQAFRHDNVTIDAVGPDRFTYLEMVKSIAGVIGVRRMILRLPPSIGYVIGGAVGMLLRDVVITREEIGGLMANLLDSDAPAVGSTRLMNWANDHAKTLGIEYRSELARRR